MVCALIYSTLEWERSGSYNTSTVAFENLLLYYQRKRSSSTNSPSSSSASAFVEVLAS